MDKQNCKIVHCFSHMNNQMEILRTLVTITDFFVLSNLRFYTVQQFFNNYRYSKLQVLGIAKLILMTAIVHSVNHVCQ